MKRIIFFIIEKIRKALKVDEKGNSFGWGKGTLLLASLMMMGCLSDQQEAKMYERTGFATLTFDSCEYVFKAEGYKGFLAHKGNCRFCKERRQKELEELVEQLNEK